MRTDADDYTPRSIAERTADALERAASALRLRMASTPYKTPAEHVAMTPREAREFVAALANELVRTELFGRLDGLTGDKDEA
jgi:hypothetical protein